MQIRSDTERRWRKIADEHPHGLPGGSSVWLFRTFCVHFGKRCRQQKAIPPHRTILRHSELTVVCPKRGEAHLLYLVHHFVRGVNNLQAISRAWCRDKTLIILVAHIDFVLYHIPSPIHP